jgi:hypothetical protein
MLNALAAVQGGLQAREQAFQGQAQEGYRNALAQHGMNAPQTRQAFAAVNPVAANALMMDERRLEQQGSQFQQSFGLQEREFAARQEIQRQQLALQRAAAGRAAAGARQADTRERMQRFGAMMAAITQLPPDQQQAAYAQAYQFAGSIGADLTGAPTPDQYNPEVGMLMASHLLGQPVTGPSAPQPLSPEGKREADVRRGLLDPSAAQGRDSAAEQRIARLTEVLSEQFGPRAREIAIGIADGRLQVNEGRVFDLATGEQITSAVQPQPERLGPTRANAEGLYQRADDATGILPAAGRAVSATAGQLPIIGQAFQAPEMVAAEQAFRQAQNDLIRAISVNPRFPVAEMQMIRDELGIAPGVFSSPEDTRVRMRELDSYLRRRAEVERQAAADPSLPRSDRDNASRAVRDIDNFLSILNVPHWMLTTDPATWTEEQWGEAERSGFLNDR